MVERVGRRADLDRLVAALAANDRVLVLGAVGAGSSTLAADALDRLDRAWPRAQGLGALADVPFGAFAPILGGVPTEPGDVVRRRVERAAADGVSLDDVHRADPASRQLLATLPRWLATCRADRAELAAVLQPDAVVEVDALDGDDARRLVRAVLGPVADRSVDRAIASAGGRPRFLHEVTGRGTATSALQARLGTVVSDLGSEVAAALALLGAAEEAADRHHLPRLPVPVDAVARADTLVGAGMAAATPDGVRATPAGLARVAHDLLEGAQARHAHLAGVTLPPLHRAAHLLLAGKDPRPLLDESGCLADHVETDLLPACGILAATSDQHPEDVALAERALTVALAAGDLATAHGLAERVPLGRERVAATEHDMDREVLADTEELAPRRRQVAAAGAHGHVLAIDAELALRELAQHGPSEQVAARLLVLLDDPLLVRPRVRLAGALATTFAWLGRDADARRLLGYLRALGVPDGPEAAEVHWLAGRDHRARDLAPGSPAAAWASVATAELDAGSGDARDAEVEAARLVLTDPRGAATRLMALASEDGPATRAWRCRHGAAVAWRLAGETAAAERLATGLGDELRARGAVALLRRLGGPATTAASPPDPHGLSPREREVISLAGEGLSSRAIADHLGVSSATVETHVTAAMRKLGARTRLEAVARVGPP